MIEESGRVVALAPGAVWVETERHSTCSGCSARSGCGQGLGEKLGIRERRGLILAVSDLRLSVGDTVVVGIRESVLLRGAVLVYLFPLIMLFIAALVASELSAAEPYVMLAGLGGFLVAWLLVRKRSQQTAMDPALQPVVLRASMATAAV
ncbi:MAG: SoxR reducing system RseC family protein [Gammaproteobacteria bacterium]|jgi:sigma-E factor negative regulatory protein RseC|nr:SoxR reducing system RseC family protein [Gammaproteobacteria bacterium]HAW24467.1 transcriptional regulator [Pseudomonas sp.]MBU0854231.1 SoxR reducing system RseC family protein [Gammaproteobacteria bacterium]MBU1302121.1 SoxR reducing system RseC family protein [Gammaproteobacteria bacterium]MBU1460228.1 SoxR reducing system RseC family protein [Gammaproteobacteria bacterium]|tara:strand:- start:2746 stop:3195 length:450 start_codon:yes stop_codon:yes gene_type:complete